MNHAFRDKKRPLTGFVFATKLASKNAGRVAFLLNKQRDIIVMASRLVKSGLRVVGLYLQVLTFFLPLCGGAQGNLILNGNFEELALIRFQPTFIDGQFVFDERLDTSKFWSFIRNGAYVCAKHVNYINCFPCLTDNAIYFDNMALEGKVSAPATIQATDDLGYAFFKHMALELREPLIAGNIYRFECKAKMQSNPKAAIFLKNMHIAYQFVHRPTELEELVDFKPFASMQKKRKGTICLRKELACYEFEDMLVPDSIIRLGFEYSAVGGEKYLLIGNLKHKVFFEWKKNRHPKQQQKRIYRIGHIRALFDDCILTNADSLSNVGIDDGVLMDNNALGEAVDQEAVSIDDYSAPHQFDTLIWSFYYKLNDAFVVELDYLEFLLDQETFLRNHPGLLVLVGYADGVGRETKNKRLAFARAKNMAHRIAKDFPDIMIEIKVGHIPKDHSENPNERRVDIFWIRSKE